MRLSPPDTRTLLFQRGELTREGQDMNMETLCVRVCEFASSNTLVIQLRLASTSFAIGRHRNLGAHGGGDGDDERGKPDQKHDTHVRKCGRVYPSQQGCSGAKCSSRELAKCSRYAQLGKYPNKEQSADSTERLLKKCILQLFENESTIETQ